VRHNDAFQFFLHDIFGLVDQFFHLLPPADSQESARLHQPGRSIKNYFLGR
jgi:hypothetical protein